MSLREDVELYTKLSGEDGSQETIATIGAYLRGYRQGEEDAELEKRTETHACDSISRQAAIDALDECYCGGKDENGRPWIYKENAVEAIEMVEPLPPAQPEIIRCKDCKYNATSKKCLNPNSFFLVPTDDDFCSYAEKREVAT